MLRKKQLKDAARCCGGLCELCSCNKTRMAYQDCTREAAKTALAYREMLKELEWQSFAGEHGFIANCPMCGGAKPDVLGGGHAPNCELGNMLKGLEGESC